MREGIAVLDFGGQYSHLIANRVRRLGVYSEVFATTADPSEMEGFSGIIFSGGPSSVYDPEQPSFDPSLLQIGLPVLGLCYGHQLICQALGGEVVPGTVREYGSAILNVRGSGSLFEGLAASETVWMSHGDVVRTLPEGFSILGSTSDCPTAAVGDSSRLIFGLQFHPEVAHTPNGMKILDNFLSICEADRSWSMKNYTQIAIEEIRERVGDRNVFLLVSGGVDSTVAFVLFNRALGAQRVQGLHIDNGFMRKGETADVAVFLKEEGLNNLIVRDESDEFLLAVEGTTDPESKRRAIGQTFLDVKDRVLSDLQLNADEWLLGQGTLYPDTIESGGTEHAALIKTHHNRIEAFEELIAQGLVVEPLAGLYKDEVRDLGSQLGLPDRLVWRHPFPGPGLSVRCLCSTGQVEEDEIRDAQREAESILAGEGLKVRILPIRSVGVQGDFRTFEHPAVVWGTTDWDTLEEVSTRLTNQVRSVNRVVTLLAPGELPGLRPKRAFLTQNRLDLLREADAAAMDSVEELGLIREISQMPTVLLPVSSDGQRESVVLRPVYTPDFMTASFVKLPLETTKILADRIIALSGIEAVLYDVTHKPPGTVEWE